MGQYPLGMILCVVSLILLCTFLITSANSGTFVLAMFSSKGDLNPKNGRKVLWGVVQSLLAVGLLVAGGLKPSDYFACSGIPLYIHYAVCRGCPCEGFDEREIAVW